MAGRCSPSPSCGTIHLVVGVLDDPDPARLLHDFKSYATRALNQAGHRPSGARWWTESGSRRKLRNPRAAVVYVRNQEHSLVIEIDEQAVSLLDEESPDEPGERGVSTP